PPRGALARRRLRLRAERRAPRAPRATRLRRPPRDALPARSVRGQHAGAGVPARRRDRSGVHVRRPGLLRRRRQRGPLPPAAFPHGAPRPDGRHRRDHGARLTMSTSAQPTPFSAFNFSVEIQVPGLGGGSVCDAAFAECDGLEMSLDVKTIREGSNNGRQIKLAGPFTFGQLTLKRGMTTSFDLWDWFQMVAEDPTLRADGHVVLFGADGTEKARFNLSRCIPIKLKAPALNAKEGPIAIEEMQIAYESLAFERPPSSSTHPATAPLAKAQIIQVDQKGNELAEGRMDVQFNPESLKVSFSNQIQTPDGAGAGDQKGPAACQFVGAGTTKLTAQLVFDVTG